MPRKIVDTNSEGPFHITARTINKEWFNIPMPEVWDVMSNQLFFLSHAFDFSIHAFVLMANHYHLLTSTPKFNISHGMAYFNREVSRELNRLGNRINRTFAGRYFKCNIGDNHYFMSCYKYVYQNPVRAGLVAKCEDYPFSTLYGSLGRGPLLIPMAEDKLLFDGEVARNLSWLNARPSKQDEESVRLALMKGRFKLRKDLSNRKLNRLETDVL